MSTKDVTLEIFGQQPLPIYTQISFCYSHPEDGPTSDEIVAKLQSGLQRLSVAFPWVAGQVVRDKDSKLFKISCLDRTPQLVVKDYRNTNIMAPMEQLEHENFPITLLPESLVAPRSTLAGIFGDCSVDPVFLGQVTFINGGVLLTFLAHHQVFDGTGQAQIISWLSQGCYNSPFSTIDLKVGNMDREHLVPLFTREELAQYGPLEKKLAHQIVGLPAKNQAPRQCIWASLEFLSASLTQLKTLANHNLRAGTSFVSTDDALTAFLWQSITRIRQSRLAPSARTQIARAVNVRSYLGVPALFPGVINNMTYNHTTVSELAEAPLGHVASLLRAELAPETSTLRDDSRALATLINSTKSNPIVSATAAIDADSDIALSSWALQNSYNLDFALGLGSPRSVRRPEFTAVESLLYILPKANNGDIAVALCLCDSDMEALRQDKQLQKYAHYLG